MFHRFVGKAGRLPSAGDAESLPFPKGQDLIVSCSALQWFVSPELFFERCNTLLKQKGYFAFTTFGRDNLKEVASVTGSGLHYRSLEELEEALRIHYEIVKAHEERIHLTLRYPLEVLLSLETHRVAACQANKRGPKGLQDF